MIASLLVKFDPWFWRFQERSKGDHPYQNAVECFWMSTKKSRHRSRKKLKQQTLLEKRFTVFYGIWENYNYNDEIAF